MKLRFKRRGQVFLALLCSLVLALSIIPVFAEDEDSLKSKTSDLEDQLSGINQELLTISDKIDTAKKQIIITNAEILRTEDSLADAKENEAKQYEAMKSRIKYMYETGNASLLEMLFSAENMTDFLNKADFIRNISSYDRDALTELQKTRQEIADKKETLVAQQESMVTIQKDLENSQDELEARAKATSTDLESYKAQLEKLRAEEAERARKEAERAKKEAEKAAQEAAARANAEKEAAASDNGNSNGGDSGNNSSGNGGYDGTVINGGATNVGGSDLDIFAAILQCEAAYDYDSMLAVATVIMNRVNSPSFPNSITDVVYAGGQFEPVWSGRLDSVLASGAGELAYTVAQDAINGARLAAVSDCYYFLYAGAAVGITGVNIGNNLFFPSW